MLRLLGSLELDARSFLLGLVSGLLLFWLLSKFRPLLADGIAALRRRVQAARREMMAGVEARWAGEIIRLAQGWHLAAPLFSLEEILIPPRLLAPPAAVEPGLPEPNRDISEQVLPYLPDWPELAAVYRYPTITLAEALSGGAHLALTGRPGSGKSVTLAHLALLVARKDPQAGDLAGHTPFLLHAADLPLPRDTDNLLDPLVRALQHYASSLTASRLPRFVESTLAHGQALLLLDGLDELPGEQVEVVVQYLGEVLQQYPQVRCAAAGSARCLDGLTALGFIPVAVAAWTREQQRSLVLRWGELWAKYIETPPVDPAVITGWLVNDPILLPPLDLTLKVWGAFAGDLPGPAGRDGLQAWVRRLCCAQQADDQTEARRTKLQALALQSVLARRPVFTRREAEQGLIQASGSTAEEPTRAQDPAVEAESQTLETSQELTPSQRELRTLVESGLLVKRSGGRLSFAHPVLAGFLAGEALGALHTAPAEAVEALFAQAEWSGKDLCLMYMPPEMLPQHCMQKLLAGVDQDPLQAGLFSAARWLPEAPENAPWKAPVMRRLAACLQDETLPEGTRARALAALAGSRSSGVDMLLRRSLNGGSDVLRRLALLGCGALQDSQAVEGAVRVLGEPGVLLRQAACLALAAIGNKPALEAVASALLHGDDELKRAAAQALANHPEEGHPALIEGSTLEDVLVRRAVITGLQRLGEPWAVEQLKKIQLEDEQWLVKNAADQALEEMDKANPRIPRPLPALENTPWVIQWAGEKGIGVVPGRPAYNLVCSAAKEGSRTQRLAAMRYLALHGEEDAAGLLLDVYRQERGELREAALQALWILSGRGFNLSPN